MNLLHRCLAVLLALLPTAVLSDTLASGRVFLDANANGRRDGAERGVEGVKVSNGRAIVTTDARGRYRIGVRDGDTLFVIKPAGYRFPTRSNGLPVFWKHHFPKGTPNLKYGAIVPSNARRADFALLPHPAEDTSAFEVLVLADPQMKDMREMDFYARSIIEPARHHSGISLGLTLGDLVNDALDLYPELNRLHAALGIPFLHAPGNHDIDFDVADDRASLTNYRRTFGPDTVAWEMKGHAFIALDDVIYMPGQRPSYIGGLREDQFAFLDAYLATLPADTRVVMSFHIPLFDDPHETFRHPDRERLFRLLERFPEPLILSGHTHTQRHHFHGSESGWRGVKPLHEYNVGAACGGYWSGLIDADDLPDARMEDGTPNGYAILRFGEDGYTTRYHASRGRDSLRMAVTSPGVLRRGAYPVYPVLANVYAAEPDATLQYRIDGGEWQPMVRVFEPDPSLLAINIDDSRAETLRSFDRAVIARSSMHLWGAGVPTDLAAGEHLIEVRAQSRFEGELTAATTYRLVDWRDE
ncbi:calcineurin-like phosphoesterase family protein [Xanthomonadaceae bacterium XH05]|nr:calcineurin-like phosphoesterase family protein [Xanthomonadaceae bacterium XH05]